jgi:hypothetical protein
MLRNGDDANGSVAYDVLYYFTGGRDARKSHTSAVA